MKSKDFNNYTLYSTGTQKNLPRHNTGVFVSLKPRKMPWRAKETTTAGAPRALSERNLCAGACIDEACNKMNLMKTSYR